VYASHLNVGIVTFVAEFYEIHPMLVFFDMDMLHPFVAYRNHTNHPSYIIR
jgi:hypothetical protein